MRQPFQLFGKRLLGYHRLRRGALAVFIGRIERAVTQRIAFRAPLGAHGLFGLGNKARDVVNGFADRLRHNAMLFVIGHLNLAAALRLLDGLFHRIGHNVCVHDDFAVGITGSTANRLNQRTAVAQETFLVGIENCHQRDLGKVQTLAEQVDANKNIDLSLAQRTQDLDTIHRRRIGVHVIDLNAGIEQMVGQVLGHTLGQCGHQHTLFTSHALANLVLKVVNLAANRTYIDLGVEQTGRTNNLLDVVLADAQLIVARRGRNVDELGDPRLKLIETKRAVIERRRKTETMLNQRHLTRTVAFVHTADLRNRHMALIDDAEHVLGKVID